MREMKLKGKQKRKRLQLHLIFLRMERDVTQPRKPGDHTDRLPCFLYVRIGAYDFSILKFKRRQRGIKEKP